MRIVLGQTAHAGIQALQDGICEVAAKAFLAVPRREILRRFSEYPEIAVAVDATHVRGFLFASWHSTPPHHYLGFRMAAVDPDWQGRGILGQLSTRMFVRHYVRFFVRKILRLRVNDRLYGFGRVCSPIAYTTLHAGQQIYPDLISSAACHLPADVQARYTELAALAGLTGLDVRTGLLPNGAASAGLVPGGHDISVAGGWVTPWSEYVPAGSELLVLFPVGFWLPMRHGRQLLRMGLKRLGRPS